MFDPSACITWQIVSWGKGWKGVQIGEQNQKNKLGSRACHFDTFNEISSQWPIPSRVRSFGAKNSQSETDLETPLFCFSKSNLSRRTQVRQNARAPSLLPCSGLVLYALCPILLVCLTFCWTLKIWPFPPHGNESSSSALTASGQYLELCRAWPHQTSASQAQIEPQTEDGLFWQQK
jgi:hypothetical protein